MVRAHARSSAGFGRISALVVFLPMIFLGGCSGGGNGKKALGANANLASLVVSAGGLAPVFDPGMTTYSVRTGNITTDTMITAVTEDANAALTINGTAAVSAQPFGPISLNPGLNAIDVAVTAQDGTTKRNYTVLVNRTLLLAQEAYVKASNTGMADGFGAALEISGDTMAVGASREDSEAPGINGDQVNDLAPESGAAYVFDRSSGVWSQEAYVKASNCGSLDLFGYALDLEGDTLVVGAPGEASSATGIGGNEADDGAPGAGAVYVFTRTAGVWSQEAYLKASNTQSGYAFGSSVALDGDTLVVGSPGESSDAMGVNGDQNNANAPGSGAAYVFTRNAGTWSQEAYIKASNSGAGDAFGTQVALRGEALGISAPGEDSDATGINGDPNNENAEDSGAVYIYGRHPTQIWRLQAYVKASNSEPFDRFGASIDISTAALIVGAPGEDSGSPGINGDQADNSAPGAGAVYVYVNVPMGVGSLEAYLKPTNPGGSSGGSDPGDNFGSRLVLQGGAFGDVLVAGALAEDSQTTGLDGDEGNDLAPAAGAAYVFERINGFWGQIVYVKASNTETQDHFGTALAIDGNTFAAAAVDEDSSATGLGGDELDNGAGSSGAVYVFR